jgi:hypothetical protein
VNESWATTGNSFVSVFTRGRLRTRWYWHCQAPNGEIGCQGEGYQRRVDAISAALRHHPRVEDQR